MKTPQVEPLVLKKGGNLQTQDFKGVSSNPWKQVWKFFSQSFWVKTPPKENPGVIKNWRQELLGNFLVNPEFWPTRIWVLIMNAWPNSLQNLRQKGVITVNVMTFQNYVGLSEQLGRKLVPKGFW